MIKLPWTLFFIIGTATCSFNQVDESYACIREFCFLTQMNVDNCTKNHDFMSSDPALQQIAFKEGKQCFIYGISSDYTKYTCTRTIIDHITLNYDIYMESIVATPTSETSCKDPYYAFESCRCRQSYDITENLVNKYKWADKKMSIYKQEEVMNQCKDFKKCANECFSQYPDIARISAGCDIVELKYSPFMSCLTKLRNREFKLPHYNCTDSNFRSRDIEVLINMFTEDMYCTKWIMRKHCDESAVIDFRKYASFLASNLKGTLVLFSGYNAL
ncbi:T20D4.11-like domain-containing protein [Caenorhabditis elegans]|uniref:T20D4.11-like domain-containing protein n=1 Tax=Caenorhabditis elegans TaxID=6239 RepID=M1Z865_CAEEL|nr:DUF19 domain-containing protein [Caenorhabditis elegans]CCU83337.1 DUF19 domain-containing protein [Caenorhabditis elegans]|eukprot:NP_001294736.1 Uncharacterized protein CELE_ZK105.12 [Caenorhabditis elegans]